MGEVAFTYDNNHERLEYVIAIDERQVGVYGHGVHLVGIEGRVLMKREHWDTLMKKLGYTRSREL